ncbi:hypothetical protein KKB55_13020 [Myxococcota bacterium]|nr:hypothetical protein [Myxococcota bacterium]
MRACPLLLLLSLAHAEGAPFIDGDLILISPDNDPDLIVAREGYEAQARLQSVYLRMHDARPDVEVISGTLSLVGGEIVEIISDGQALAASDARWGVIGDYGPAAARGLELIDEAPTGLDGGDVVRLLSPQTLRFFFSCADDIDDLRLIIRYPDEPGSASFSIHLYGPRRPDPRGWPLTTQGGVQVGSLERHIAPDDGDYSEVFEVERLKLWVEDLDIEEARLDFGAVGVEGGVLGPLSFHVNNDFAHIDADQDNGFDQNGTISPIPSTSALDHLRYEVTDLLNERAARLPSEAVTLSGMVEALPYEGRAAVAVQIEAPAWLDGGRYRGRVNVWEDNDGDGARGGAEAMDAVWLELVVGAPPDPPIDAGAPPDVGVFDAAPLDQSFEPQDGGALDGFSLDLGPLNDASEDALGDDARVLSDAGDAQGDDARVLSDAGDALGDDTRVLSDAGDAQGDDARILSDAGDAQGDDARILSDAGDAQGDDARVLSDAGDAQGDDARVLSDAGLDLRLDEGVAGDAKADAKADARPLGDARGGACDCQAQPGAPPALLWLLLPLIWRRR